MTIVIKRNYIVNNIHRFAYLGLPEVNYMRMA